MLVTRRIGSDGATTPGSDDRRYVGELDSFGRRVWIEEGGLRRALPYRGEGLPVTFVWSRVGIGARELARSILLDATDNPALADRLCRELTHEVIAALPVLGFELDRSDVLTWLANWTRDPMS